MRAVVFVIAAITVAGATPAAAYTVKGGDVLVKGVGGASVNVARLDVATKGTPPAGLALGCDIDWSVDGSWSVATSIRPVLSPGFVDGSVGVGARYRLLQLDAPFIPFAVAQVTTAVGGPLGFGDVHINVGARIGGGVDYWVMRDLAVGVEISTEGSGLIVPLPTVEWSTDALLGLTWRL
ncbi:MAG: hypothetical protein FJ137_19590 [Deltaproteobacteria bacterium]|nr:hypothetical protein [Deltaproteobacteria bacterium]